MKYSLTICLIFLSTVIWSQEMTLMTWNIRHLGGRLDPIQLDSIATVMNKADLVGIQEVVINETGDEALAILHSKLLFHDSSWRYIISGKTESDPHYAERYAIFWRQSKLNKIGDPWLEFHYGEEFQREPFMCVFEIEGIMFNLAILHAKSKKNNPESELKYLKHLPDLYEYPLVFAGDFNVESENSVFIPLLKKGYRIANSNLKTSLKTNYIEGVSVGSRMIDNVLTPSQFEPMKTQLGITLSSENHFDFWHTVSDHLPLVTKLKLR